MERVIFLSVILLLVLLIGLQYYWFNLHYDHLMEAFDIIWRRCK